ncbi:putative Urea transporter [Balamuthia mandrillaris]
MEEEEAKREFVDWMKATKTKTKNKKGGEAEEEEEEEDAEMEPNGRRATLKHRGSIIAFAAWGDGSKLRPISSSSSSSQKPNVTPKKPNKKKHTPHSLYSPSSSSSSSSASSSEEEEEDEEQQHVTTAERKKKMKQKQGSIISWQAWGQGNKLRPSAAAATTKAASASKHQKKEKQQRLETFRRKMRKLSQGEKHTEAEAEAEEEAKEEEEEGQERINMDEEGEEEEASSSEEEEEEEGSSSSSSSSAMSTISEPENENVDEEDDEEKVRKMVIVRRVFNKWRDKTFTERELQLQERRKRRSKSPPSNKDKTSGHRPHSSRTGIKDRASRNRIYRRYRRPNLLYKGVYSIEDLWSRYFWWCAYLTGTMKEWSCLAGRFWPLDFLDYTLRGSGQVYFTNNPITGLFLLIGIFAEDAYLGVCALLGLVSSTTFAVFLGS